MIPQVLAAAGVLEILGATFSAAVGMMISPLPIIALILVLMGKHPASKAIAFTLAWILAILIMIYGAIHLGSGTDSQAPTKTNGFLQLGLGIFFFAFGVKQLVAAYKTREHPALPNWMNGVADLSVAKCFGLAFVLSITNVKNIPLAAEAINSVTALTPPAIPRTTQLIAAILFAIITAAPFIIPTLYTMSGGKNVRHTLERLKEFLTHYNHLIMGGLFVMMGSQSIGGAIQIIVARTT